MSKTKKILSVFIFSALAVLSIVILSKTASAKVWSSADSLDLIKSACSCGLGQHQELIQLKNEIAASETVNQARAMALVPTDEAIGALKNARTIMPFSDDLRIAETRLSDARSRILVASSQEQVANEFSGMMLAGLDSV